MKDIAYTTELALKIYQRGAFGAFEVSNMEILERADNKLDSVVMI